MSDSLDNIKIEFFHDTICSFCFPLSYRMRQLKEQYPEVEIIHRSFALTPQPEDFSRMFGSREHAKTEILQHWDHANKNDDLHRFNIKGMEEQNFPFPYSMPGLRAAKAAQLLGGDALYWDVFDALQQALFVENKNIESDEVIKIIIENLKIDVEAWRKFYESEEVQQAIDADLQLASQYGVRSVPNLIVNGQFSISGAQPLETIVEGLQRISTQATLDAANNEGASCEVNDKGNWVCD